MNRLATFNRLYGQLPPYLNFTEGQIERILREYTTAWKRHYPETHHFRWELLEWPGDAARAGLYHNGQEGFITFLTSPDTEELAAYLHWILERSAALGIAQPVFGGARDPLGLGWSGLPATALSPVIDALIQDFQYQISESWIICEHTHLQTIDFQKLTEPEKEIRLEYRENPEAGEWDLLAFDLQEQTGECNAWNIPTYFDTLLTGPKWGTLEWIGVEEPFQGRGIGKTLLLGQLARQKALGIDQLVLWTESDNQIARRFFAKHGFREIEEVVTLIR